LIAEKTGCNDERQQRQEGHGERHHEPVGDGDHTRDEKEREQDLEQERAALEEARRRGAKVIGEVELAAPMLKGKTIGVTGSNGKTTTTSLIGHILRDAGVPVQVGGNIGVPVTAMIDSSRDDGWNVLELSSFQLETIRDFRADIGVCLNVTPDHLDRHKTMEAYAGAKARMFENQTELDAAVLNADDATTVGYAPKKPQLFWLSRKQAVKQGAYLKGEDIVVTYKGGEEFVMKAQEILESKYNVAADVWSVTSYTELYREGHACERWNMLHPGGAPRVPYVTQCLKDAQGVLIAASDYVKALPDSIDRWLPRPLTALGTDGFGRSESRAALREFFEVDYRYVMVATLAALARDGKIEASVVEQAIKAHNINPEKSNPAIS
jgi:hypothetical protein